MHTSSLLVPIFIFYSDLLPRTIPGKSWSLHNVDRSRFFGFWRINHSTAGDEISKVSLIWTSTKIAVKRLVYFLRLCSPFFSSRRKSHFFFVSAFLLGFHVLLFFEKRGAKKTQYISKWVLFGTRSTWTPTFPMESLMGITELTLGTRTLPATKGGLELYWTSKRTWATARPSLAGVWGG